MALDSIQIFDATGEATTVLYYMDSTFGAEKDGWYLNGTDYVEDYDFPRGQSFWTCFASTDGFTESGAVNTDEKTFTVPGDYMYASIGNPFPVSVYLNDFEFSSTPMGLDSIQIFDETGEATTVLYYMDSTFGAEKDGWYLNGTDYLENYEFPAGQGFWTCFALSTDITIPGIEL